MYDIMDGNLVSTDRAVLTNNGIKKKFAIIKESRYFVVFGMFIKK